MSKTYFLISFLIIRSFIHDQPAGKVSLTIRNITERKLLAEALHRDHDDPEGDDEGASGLPVAREHPGA